VALITVSLLAACGSNDAAHAPTHYTSVTNRAAAEETWYVTDLGETGTIIPVGWKDGRRLPPVHVPTAGQSQLTGVAASADGRLFLGRETLPGTNDQVQVVVDGAGKVLAQLDGMGTLYAWPADTSSVLCVIHDATGVQGDVRLGVLDLTSGQERDFFRFPHDPTIGLHGVVGCSMTSGRVTVVELAPEGTTAAAVAVVGMSGQLIAQRKVGSTGHDARVISSDDGALYAENPVNQNDPCLIRDASSGRQIRTLPGRRVRAFDGTDADALTTDAQPQHPQSEPLMTIQLVQLQSNRVLWQSTGYFRGSRTWEGHSALAVGIADRPVPGHFGYRILRVDATGVARVVVESGNFA
jgi:hypothetical protein